jgi:hypothetical protein
VEDGNERNQEADDDADDDGEEEEEWSDGARGDSACSMKKHHGIQ